MILKKFAKDDLGFESPRGNMQESVDFQYEKGESDLLLKVKSLFSNFSSFSIEKGSKKKKGKQTQA